MTDKAKRVNVLSAVTILLLSAYTIKSSLYALDDEATSISYGGDGNIYVAGYVTYNTCDFLVISLDSEGQRRWAYSYNGSANSYDMANSVVYGSDGNVYAAGYISETGTYWDFAVVSLDSSGTERWVYTYDGPGNYYDEAKSIVYGLDGNLYITGYSYNSSAYLDFDLIVISLDTSGGERWVYRYNGSGDSRDFVKAIVYGSNGNIYVAGYTTNTGTREDFTVISLDTTGLERWVFTYNGSADTTDKAKSIVYGSDGYIYASGDSWGTGDNQPAYTVVSLTDSGDIRWVYKYGQWGGSKSIIWGLDNNIYTSGWNQIGASGGHLSVIKLDTSGAEGWVYNYRESEISSDMSRATVYGIDGNLYSAGHKADTTLFHTDFLVMSLDTLGVERWVYIYTGNSGEDDVAYSIAYGSDGNVYAGGFSTNLVTGRDLTVISINSAGETNWIYLYDESGTTIEENSFSPSPKVLSISTFFEKELILKFNKSSMSPLKITLYNILGSPVFERSFPYISNSVTVSDAKITSLPSGIYIVSVLSGEKKPTRAKLVKLF